MASDFARYLAKLRQALFDEEILDKQFIELEKIETPHFLDDVCSEYFKDARKFFNCMVTQLHVPPPFNFNLIGMLLDRYKGRAKSLGAAKVTEQINIMKDFLKSRDMEECMFAFEGLKRESDLLQFRLENYLKVRSQGPPAEIEDRPVYGNMDIDSD